MIIDIVSEKQSDLQAHADALEPDTLIRNVS